MNTAKTIEGYDFADFHEPPHLALRWLGPQRLRVLRLRDRLVAWQMRHFYYRHESQARLGARLSVGLVLGHMLTLALRAVANAIGLGLPMTFPLDIIQAGALLVPGLTRSARRMSLAGGKSLYRYASTRRRYHAADRRLRATLHGT